MVFRKVKGWMPMQVQGKTGSGPRLTPDLEAEVLVQVAMGGGGALVLVGLGAIRRCSNFAPLRLSSAYFSPARGSVAYLRKKEHGHFLGFVIMSLCC
jgi:hypothetical protein